MNTGPVKSICGRPSWEGNCPGLVRSGLRKAGLASPAGPVGLGETGDVRDKGFAFRGDWYDGMVDRVDGGSRGSGFRGDWYDDKVDRADGGSKGTPEPDSRIGCSSMVPLLDVSLAGDEGSCAPENLP